MRSISFSRWGRSWSWRMGGLKCRRSIGWGVGWGGAGFGQREPG